MFLFLNCYTQIATRNVQWTFVGGGWLNYVDAFFFRKFETKEIFLKLVPIYSSMQDAMSDSVINEQLFKQTMNWHADSM